MVQHHMVLDAAAATARRVPALLLLMLLCTLAVCAVVLVTRHIQEMRGEGAVAAPDVEPSQAAALEESGRFEVPVAYTSLAAPGDGEVTSQVAWDDGWFFQDASSYNHELARTSSVLAALAYSESGYYQAHSTQPAYMEEALASLGFTDVSTESYRYRSEIVDEVLNLFTDDSDSVAYAIARKHLNAADGRPRDLILVSVRGSYGSEWLSNLNLMPHVGADGQDASATDEQAPATPLDPLIGHAREYVEAFARPLTDALTAWVSFAEDLATLRGHGSNLLDILTRSGGGKGADGASFGGASGEAELQVDGTGDHTGYFRASEEIMGDVASWIAESHATGAEVSVLLVGHSRGGAIANLVAAELCDQLAARDEVPDAASHALDGVASVCAYTFAAPATTVSDQAHDARYDGIFNIVNPSDIMPYLPLRAWGYERYGVNLYLPAVDEDGFSQLYTCMAGEYERTVGVACPYDPRDKHTVDAVISDVSNHVETAHDLMTPAGAAAVITSCVTHVDPVRILYGHYPSTYTAWMDVLDADDLVREGA